MSKFRLPRKTKKKYRFFRSRIEKLYWRNWFKKYHISWRLFIEKHSYFYYSYNQEGYDTFKEDRSKNFICDNCGNRIDEYCEYPEHHHSDPHTLLCEDCYKNEYRDTCELCEESYEKEDCKGGDFPKSPSAVYNPGHETDYHGNVIQSGIYEAIAYPVFTSDYFSCSTRWENLRLICTMEEWLKIRPHDIDFFSGDELKAQFICDSCWEKAKEIRDKLVQIL